MNGFVSLIVTDNDSNLIMDFEGEMKDGKLEGKGINNKIKDVFRLL
jgi:hypothetical protein